MLRLYFALLFCLNLATLVVGQAQDICYTEGECTDSLYIDLISAPTPADCSLHCDSLVDDEDLCQHFTHYADSGDCYTFYQCVTFSDTSCNDCVSGPRYCQEELMCHLPGQCLDGGVGGTVTTGVSTANDCLELCKQNGEEYQCNWFSHNGDSMECTTWETCPEISSQDCSDCVYGQVQCDPSEDVSQTYLLAVGGQDEIAGLRVEASIVKMVPLADGALSYCDCDLINHFFPSELEGDYLLGIQEQVMVMDQGEPIVCGGLLGQDENAEVGNRCYEPFLESLEYRRWKWQDAPFSMLHPRVNGVSVKLDDGRYWIIGTQFQFFMALYEFSNHIKYPQGGSEFSPETELYSSGGIFEPGPELPVNVDRACAANIGGNRIVITGGNSYDDGSSLDQVLIYDWNTLEWVTSLSPMPLARHGHACGPWINKDNGAVELVVVGGVGAVNSTIVYNFEEDAWRDGTPYEEDEFSYGSSIPFQDTLMVLGGRNGDSSEFYESGYILDENEDWEERADLMYFAFSQGTVDYISQEKVVKWGCAYILDD